VALFVSESRLPDAHVLAAFNSWRAVVPTARRLIAAHWETFREDAEALREGLGKGLGKGKFDAYLLMPRGVRDEEFRNQQGYVCTGRDVGPGALGRRAAAGRPGHLGARSLRRRRHQSRLDEASGVGER
jgi:hypothetical protein